MLVQFPFEATTPWLKPPIHSSPPISFFFMVSSPPISNCITHKKRNVTSKNRQSSKFTGKLSNHAKVLEHINFKGNFKMFSASIRFFFFFGKEKGLKMKRRSGEMGVWYAIREIPCCAKWKRSTHVTLRVKHVNKFVHVVSRKMEMCVLVFCFVQRINRTGSRAARMTDWWVRCLVTGEIVGWTWIIDMQL